MLKRHAIQVLIDAGHTDAEVAKLVGASERSVRRIAHENVVATTDDAAERKRRQIARPSKAEPFRDFVENLLKAEPELMSLVAPWFLARASLHVARRTPAARRRPHGADRTARAARRWAHGAGRTARAARGFLHAAG